MPAVERATLESISQAWPVREICADTAQEPDGLDVREVVDQLANISEEPRGSDTRRLFQDPATVAIVFDLFWWVLGALADEFHIEAQRRRLPSAGLVRAPPAECSAALLQRVALRWSRLVVPLPLRRRDATVPLLAAWVAAAVFQSIARALGPSPSCNPRSAELRRRVAHLVQRVLTGVPARDGAEGANGEAWRVSTYEEDTAARLVRVITGDNAAGGRAAVDEEDAEGEPARGGALMPSALLPAQTPLRAPNPPHHTPRGAVSPCPTPRPRSAMSFRTAPPPEARPVSALSLGPGAQPGGPSCPGPPSSSGASSTQTSRGHAAWRQKQHRPGWRCLRPAPRMRQWPMMARAEPWRPRFAPPPRRTPTPSAAAELEESVPLSPPRRSRRARADSAMQQADAAAEPESSRPDLRRVSLPPAQRRQSTKSAAAGSAASPPLSPAPASQLAGDVPSHSPRSQHHQPTGRRGGGRSSVASCASPASPITQAGSPRTACAAPAAPQQGAPPHVQVGWWGRGWAQSQLYNELSAAWRELQEVRTRGRERARSVCRDTGLYKAAGVAPPGSSQATAAPPPRSGARRYWFASGQRGRAAPRAPTRQGAAWAQRAAADPASGLEVIHAFGPGTVSPLHGLWQQHRNRPPAAPPQHSRRGDHAVSWLHMSSGGCGPRDGAYAAAAKAVSAAGGKKRPPQDAPPRVPAPPPVPPRPAPGRRRQQTGRGQAPRQRPRLSTVPSKAVTTRAAWATATLREARLAATAFQAAQHPGSGPPSRDDPKEAQMRYDRALPGAWQAARDADRILGSVALSKQLPRGAVGELLAARCAATPVLASAARDRDRAARLAAASAAIAAAERADASASAEAGGDEAAGGGVFAGQAGGSVSSGGSEPEGSDCFEEGSEQGEEEQSEHAQSDHEAQCDRETAEAPCRPRKATFI
eukprot:TRINITY_DN71967_c0_g1_i1.p1 TRINITY_DN71967_c0_g1~~TRINITY_DN71967_c0_g1_i1.p1  ORF type:complete len:949 (+),score=203.96 TRINITY_DN71967_c0_g1_i1:60-2849(+)